MLTVALKHDDAVIVSAVRTPIGTFGGTLAPMSASDLGAVAIEEAVNRAGIAHLAFAVADVDATRERVKREGGGDVGKPVSVEIPGAGSIRFVYVTDPEGNIIELQTWMNGP